jgi:mandelate racemase
LNRTLGTSARTIRNAPLLLVELTTEEGVSGQSYAFCYLESVARSLQVVVAELGHALAGRQVAPLALSKAISRHFKLPGLTGPLLMVASAVDVAAWDALSVAADLPLAEFLGTECEPVQAYNSCGLSLIEPQAAADEALALLDGGFRGVKMRMGRPDFRDDIAAVRAVRKRLPEDVALMVDFNQALTFSQAMVYCPQLDDEGIYWIEEPIRHDDYKHAALIAQASKTPIQLGENFSGLSPVLESVNAVASDYLMFDLDRIGGISGWQQAAGIAASVGREVSTHLFPEVSAHLLAATPTGHWLEYVDWASALLQEPLAIKNGMAIVASGPGNGLRWDKDAIERFAID